MKKVIILVIILVLFFLGFLIFANPFKKEQLSAMQISSLPKATVFLDGKHIGRTPFYDEKLKSGEFTLKLVPEENGKNLPFWIQKIKLTPDTLTAINWQFGQTERLSEGEIIALEKVNGNSQIAVITTPDQVQVKIDSDPKGVSPLFLKDLKEGDHEVVLFKDGYNQRTIKVKTVSNYRLAITAWLSKSDIATSSSEIKDQEATISAEIKKQDITITETGMGWLRVREEPSLSASEAARVNTGDNFSLLEEKDGWIKIEYKKGQFGWVSSDYTKKQE